MINNLKIRNLIHKDYQNAFTDISKKYDIYDSKLKRKYILTEQQLQELLVEASKSKSKNLYIIIYLSILTAARFSTIKLIRKIK